MSHEDKEKERKKHISKQHKQGHHKMKINCTDFILISGNNCYDDCISDDGNVVLVVVLVNSKVAIILVY